MIICWFVVIATKQSKVSTIFAAFPRVKSVLCTGLHCLYGYRMGIYDVSTLSTGINFIKVTVFFKANFSLSPTWAKFCQLIASLSVVLPQLNLAKLKLEYLKLGFSSNKKDINTVKIFLHHSSSTFFKFSSSSILKYGRLFQNGTWRCVIALSL